MTHKIIRNAAATLAVLFMTSAVMSAPSVKPNWLTTVTVSNTGGHIIGNPAAATKIVEYASYTCSHCATFEAKEAPLLKSQYIPRGNVSFEIRNLVRDQVDLAIAMTARCGGTAKFFGNHKLLMANQNAIMAKAQYITAATQAKLTPGNIEGFLVDAYRELGLSTYMAQRGVTAVQVKACLTDKATIERVLAMSDEATGPLEMTGTPTFMVNGKVMNEVHNLDGLRPFLSGK